MLSRVSLPDKPMKIRWFRFFVWSMSTCGWITSGLGAQGQAPSYPAFVVDAQLSIMPGEGLGSWNNPHGVAVAPGGVVYVADTGNLRVLKITPGGASTTVNFPGLSPALVGPSWLALDGSGNLYVADNSPHLSRIIELPSNGGAAKTLLSYASKAYGVEQYAGLASDASGDLAFTFVGNADIFSLPAGGKQGFYNGGGTGISSPTSVAFGPQGQLYFVVSGNSAISSEVYVLPAGSQTATEISPPGHYLSPGAAVSVDAQNDVFLLNPGYTTSPGYTNMQLIEIPSSGAAAFVLPQTNLGFPDGLAADSLGNVYVTEPDDSFGNQVTEYVLQNAVNFGALPVGRESAPVTFNFEFYEETKIEQTLGYGGGELGAEYHKQPGGTCALKTYTPLTFGAPPYAIPAICQTQFTFTPKFVGGRPGAVVLKTSTGDATQLTFGSGLGGQLSLMNAAVTTKLPNVNGVLVNAADTELYFSGSAGTYRVPVEGGQPTLVAPGWFGPFAVNGAGDLFYASLVAPQGTITRVPADGSTPTTIQAPGLQTPTGAITMDYNGAFYITDYGPDYSSPTGFVLRVSPSGAESQVLPGGFVFPYLMTSDLSGNIWIADSYTQNSLEIQVGSGSNAITGGPQISGLAGIFPTVAGMDESQTLYYWDNYPDFSNVGFEYYPFLGGAPCPWINCDVPLYRIPPINDGYGYTPFYVNSITAAPDGKMYIGDGAGPGTFLVNRDLGSVPAAVFNPSVPVYGGIEQTEYVYNIGNQNVTFTDPTRIFTESGSGVGSFSYGVPASESGLPACVPSAVIPPASYCAFTVTNTNKPGSAPMVTDTLRFLTDAANNNGVSFQINGVGTPETK